MSPPPQVHMLAGIFLNLITLWGWNTWNRLNLCKIINFICGSKLIFFFPQMTCFYFPQTKFVFSTNEICILPQLKFVFYRKWNVFPSHFANERLRVTYMSHGVGLQISLIWIIGLITFGPQLDYICVTKWVTDGLYISHGMGYRLISDWSHVSCRMVYGCVSGRLHMSHRWVIPELQDGLQMGLLGATDKSHIGYTFQYLSTTFFNFLL